MPGSRTVSVRSMSPEALAVLGMPDIAYVRPVVVEGNAVWGIFSADGNGLGIAPARDLAFAAARQHDLEPVSVH